MSIERAAAAIAGARRIFVVTGAGVSAESGVPTFRGAGGLWRGFEAADLATPDAFARSPQTVWAWYRWRRALYHGCEPNPGHRALVALEERADALLLATQNVDGLHRRAGSQAMVELHGCIDDARCTRCDAIFPLPGDPVPEEAPLPRCPSCDAPARPHILWFGETYWPGILDRAADSAVTADLALVVGTSAMIWPPAQLALAAQQHGATLIEVNPDHTPLSDAADIRLQGGAAAILPALLAAAVP